MSASALQSLGASLCLLLQIKRMPIDTLEHKRLARRERLAQSDSHEIVYPCTWGWTGEKAARVGTEGLTFCLIVY